MRTLAERFNTETARIDVLICLATALGEPDSPPEALEEFLEDADNSELSATFGELPRWLLNELEEISDRHRVECLCEWLAQTQKLGFLACFSTPVMRPHKHGASYSWGSYISHWVYGDTFEAMTEAGFRFVSQQREREKKAAQCN